MTKILAEIYENDAAKITICSIFLFVCGCELIVQFLIFHKFYSVLRLVSLKKFLSPRVIQHLMIFLAIWKTQI